MPKKKKGGKIAVGLYDVEEMTDPELKAYIAALKTEYERMRLIFSGHQKDKIELSDHLGNAQDNIFNRHEVLIQKETDKQKLLKGLGDQLKAEKERNLLIQLESNEQKAKDAFDVSREVYLANADNKTSERILRNDLLQTAREKNNALLAHSSIVKDLHKMKEEEKSHLTEAKTDSLSRVATEYIEKYRKAFQHFHSEQIRTMDGVFDNVKDRNTHDSSVAVHAEKMALYFTELFWKNIQASAKLKERVSNLEMNLNKLKLELKVAQQENNSLLAEFEPETIQQQIDVDTSQSIDTKEAELENVVYENYVFSEKLRQVTVEYDVMKNRFISTMRKIYQKGDFAGYIAEQMLRSTQDSGISSAVLPLHSKQKDAAKLNDETISDISEISNDNEDSEQENTSRQSVRSY